MGTGTAGPQSGSDGGDITPALAGQGLSGWSCGLRVAESASGKDRSEASKAVLDKLLKRQRPGGTGGCSSVLGASAELKVPWRVLPFPCGLRRVLEARAAWTRQPAVKRVCPGPGSCRRQRSLNNGRGISSSCSYRRLAPLAPRDHARGVAARGRAPGDREKRWERLASSSLLRKALHSYDTARQHSLISPGSGHVMTWRLSSSPSRPFALLPLLSHQCIRCARDVPG